MLPNTEITAHKIKLTETTKLSKYREIGLHGMGSPLDLPYPRNDPNYMLLTNTLKGPHEEVPWSYPSRGQ